MKEVIKPSAQSGRNWGIDLLRCVAMSMVVVLHILAKSGLLYKTEALSAKHEIAWLLEVICYCAVNVFVLISGYVGCKSRFRASKIISLWVQVVFFSIAAMLIGAAIKNKFSVKGFFAAFFPLSNNLYWFFTQYFALFFFMPFINRAMQSLTLRQSKILSACLFVIFSVLPSVYALPFLKVAKGAEYVVRVNPNLFITKNGYSVIWLIVVYIFGVLLRRMADGGELEKLTKRACVIGIAVCDGIAWAVHYFAERGGENEKVKYIISYLSPAVLIGGAFWLILFSKLTFGGRAQKFISFISPCAFGVYLIHINPNTYPTFQKLIAPIKDYNIFLMLVCILFTVLVVFAAAVVLERLRRWIEKRIHLPELYNKIDRKINFDK